MAKAQGTSQCRPYRVIAHHSPRSPVAEAYRTLRTNIQFGALDRRVRSIMFTSAGPGEGKSTTLANLGVTLAQAGQRVILVDADFRRPVVHRIFGVEQQRGLTTVLTGRATLEEGLQDCGIENFSILPSGPLPPNPSELLGSQSMRALIGTLCERADYVLFDCPPALAVADASILAPCLDGVVLVLKAGSVTRQAAAQAKAQLEKVGAHFLGAVLNNVQIRGDDRYYYYYLRED